MDSPTQEGQCQIHHYLFKQTPRTQEGLRQSIPLNQRTLRLTMWFTQRYSQISQSNETAEYLNEQEGKH